MRKHDVSIIIPAAGIGRRMRTHGPRPMIEITEGETIVGRQIRLLKEAYPRADIVVVLGHEIDHTLHGLPKGVRVVENEKYDETNDARSIELGLRVVNTQSVLVVYGDLVFNRQAISRLDGTRSSIVVDTSGQFEQREIGAMVVDGRVTRFDYSLRKKWAQIAFVTGRELELFRRLANPIDLTFEVFNKVLEAGGKFAAVQPKGMKVAEVDASKDLARAKLIAEYSS